MRKGRKLRLYRRTRGVLLNNKMITDGNIITSYRVVFPVVSDNGIKYVSREKTRKRVLTKPKGKAPEIKRRGYKC